MLLPLLDRRLDTLSGGQSQLLAIWGALALPAEVVLLDEPTNHLDPSHVTAAVQLIQQHAPEKGVIVVSHDRAFLDRVTTRLVTLGARIEGSNCSLDTCA